LKAKGIANINTEFLHW